MYFITRNVCLFSGANHFHCCHIFYIVQWPAKCETFAGYQLLYGSDAPQHLSTWNLSRVNKPKKPKIKEQPNGAKHSSCQKWKGEFSFVGGGGRGSWVFANFLGNCNLLPQLQLQLARFSECNEFLVSPNAPESIRPMTMALWEDSKCRECPRNWIKKKTENDLRPKASH